MKGTEIQMELIQGTEEWLKLRKTKITATDSCVIMGASPWKTRIQLYEEKLSNDPPTPPNERMKRGTDLEPIARDLFMIQTGIEVHPKVIVKEWAMASLDGISSCGKHLVEIKCPGEKDHSLALSGKVPEHYYPQLQHQMWVCDVEKISYFSFDGTDGVIVEVIKDEKYLEKMIAEEKKFFNCLLEKTPPERSEDDYIERSDQKWEHLALRWRNIQNSIKDMEKEEQDLRDQLILLSGSSNTRGGGISICQVQRKGSIDYSNIPELKTIDLDKYRKPTTSSFRITCQ